MEPHMDAACQALRYIKGTLGYEILLGIDYDLPVRAYYDAD